MHAALVKRQLPGVVGALRRTARAALDIEAGRAAIDQESGHQLALAAFALLHPGAGEKDGKIRNHRTADEVLGTIDDEIVAVAFGGGRHRQDVGTSARLGECEDFLFLAGDAGFEVFFDLIAGTGHQYLRRPVDITVQAVAGFAELAFEQSQRLVVEAAAADFLGQVGRVKAHLQRPALDPLAERFRHFAVSIDLGLVRLQLLFAKSPQRAYDHVLFGSQVVIHEPRIRWQINASNHIPFACLVY
jgi:hypothetical protein